MAHLLMASSIKADAHTVNWYNHYEKQYEASSNI